MSIKSMRGVWKNACERRKGFERGEEGGEGGVWDSGSSINNQGKVGVHLR